MRLAILTAIILLTCPGLARAGLDVAPAPPDMSSYARKSDLPTAASSMPPGVGVDGATGTATSQYALANHTHATSVQRTSLKVTAAGAAVRWTFSKPYDPGTVPTVVCTVQIASGSTLPFTVNVVGTPNATYVDVIVNRVQSQVITLSALTAAATAGIALNPIVAAPPGTAVDCIAGKPTQP